MKEIKNLFIAIVLDLITLWIIGLTTMFFWEWFISPIFDIRIIGLIEAIGLSLFVNFVVRRKKYSISEWKEAGETDFDENVLAGIIHIVLCFIALIFGWLLHLFM